MIGSGGRVGDYSWGGAATTHFWISPTDDLVVVALEQFMPEDFTLVMKLRPLIQAAIEDPKE
jgi:CubicO group peptidase (beta-lactamase class C family)